MSDLPRITVITPSFNQARFVERTICSVLDQDYPNLEYFVIDGGSTDGSVDIIRQYENDLTGWTNEPDRGQTDAINKGIARATGQIIAFLNSDDVYMPMALHTVARALAEAPGPAWLIGGCAQIDTDDSPIGNFEHRPPESLASYLMRADGMLPQPSSFWAAELFARHGGFDEQMHYAFDYEFNCRLLAAGHVPTLIGDELAAFRFHDSSKGAQHAVRFGLERIVVARHYAAQLSLAERVRLWRNIGYRQRQYAIQSAQQVDGPSLWSHVIRRPWWLISSDVRQALIAPNAPERDAA